jgi:hypothetical protein
MSRPLKSHFSRPLGFMIGAEIMLRPAGVQVSASRT